MRIPKYRRHASGQAVVWLDGRDVYLGAYGSEDSKKRCDQVVARLMAGEAQSVVEVQKSDEPKPVRLLPTWM